METEEQVIISQLKAGSEQAYRQLYAKHYAALCRVAFQYVKDDFQSEALVGDVIFHLWEIRETLDIQTSLRSYLVRAVRNQCLNYLSSASGRNEVPFSALEGSDQAQDWSLPSDSHPLGLLLERELEGALDRAIKELPDECRVVFMKSRFENKKYEQISDDLGISVNTVKYHIKHALSLLHKALERYYILFLMFF